MDFRIFIFTLISLIYLCYSRMPSTYSDYYARYKLSTLVGVIGRNESEFKYWLDQCFFNHTFIKYSVVNCDMFGKNNPDVTCAGGILVSHDDEAIILVFRYTTGNGSEGVEEMNYPNITVTFPGGGTVIKFFYNAFDVLWNVGGLKDSFLAAKNSYPTYELWVTGDSLGGAISSIAAPYISQMGFFKKNGIKLVNMGALRVGKPDFVNRVAGLVPYAYRVVHRYDIVPHINSQFGYINYASEIWYNNSMNPGEPYIECDTIESPKCSDSVPSNLWTWNDHQRYFQYAECKKFTTPPPPLLS